jgi:hypothetical protein
MLDMQMSSNFFNFSNFSNFFNLSSISFYIPPLGEVRRGLFNPSSNLPSFGGVRGRSTPLVPKDCHASLRQI